MSPAISAPLITHARKAAQQTTGPVSKIYSELTQRTELSVRIVIEKRQTDLAEQDSMHSFECVLIEGLKLQPAIALAKLTFRVAELV